MHSYTDIERVARHLITERTSPTRAPAARQLPRPRRRTQLAGTLRRVADRLDG